MVDFRLSGSTKADVETKRITLNNVKPMGKPRMTRQDKWKKRPKVIRYRAFSNALRFAAGELPPAELIEDLSWVATFAFPKSYSKKKRAALMGQLHRNVPDRDNIDKGILDSLFAQDSAIAKGTIEKRWGETDSIEITIKWSSPDE